MLVHNLKKNSFTKIIIKKKNKQYKALKPCKHKSSPDFNCIKLQRGLSGAAWSTFKMRRGKPR